MQLLSGEDFGTCVEDYGNDLDFDSCMYSNLQRLMLEEVGCTVPWIPDKSQICTEESKRKKAFDVYQQNRRNQKVLIHYSFRIWIPTDYLIGPM